MSARTTSQVTSVSGTALTAAAVGGAVVAAGIIALIVKGLSAAARASYTLCTSTLNKNDGVVKSAASLRLERQTVIPDINRITTSAKLSELEAAKVSVLATAASMPYRVNNPEALRSVLRTIEVANSVLEVRQAEEHLRQVLETQHHQVFVKTLTLACERATVAAGFKTVEVKVGAGEKMRLLGTDPAGHALVTEINVNPLHESDFSTEIFGITDGTCTAILDKFEEALAKEGVRGTPPKRELTGGICELETTLDFIRRKVRPTQSRTEAALPAEPEEETRRRWQDSARLHNQR